MNLLYPGKTERLAFNGSKCILKSSERFGSYRSLVIYFNKFAHNCFYYNFSYLLYFHSYCTYRCLVYIGIMCEKDPVCYMCLKCYNVCGMPSVTDFTISYALLCM